MDKNAIKKYAVWARTELIDRVRQRAALYGITAEADPNADSVNGKILSAVEKNQRQAAIKRMQEKGCENVIEEAAYTWFNRLAALRYMEVNGVLPSRVRVFTDVNGEFKPQILTEAIHLKLDGLDVEKVYVLKEQEASEELYKYLIITQCNALSSVLPGMFQKIDDYTEILFPDNLLREGSVAERMVSDIQEDDWKDAVQIIGWLYQYYNDERKNEIINIYKGIVNKEDIPAATQLFTTDWVVRYLVDNSVGRYWIERNPHSSLMNELQFYVLPKSGKQTYVQETIKPEELTVFDPCMGSAHFLVYAFDVLMKIYLEYGYSGRESVQSIIENNLYGLDIDARATQLAYFAVMMKAAQYDSRYLKRNKIPQPQIYEIKESNSLDSFLINYFNNGDSELTNEINSLINLMRDAKEYGSMINVTSVDFSLLYERVKEIEREFSFYRNSVFEELLPVIKSAELLSRKYCVVVTNPPYLNKMDTKIKKYVNEHFKDYSGDLFSVFMYQGFSFCQPDGYCGFMTPFVWMFIKTYEKLRHYIIEEKAITTLVQMEYSAFEEATVPICCFVLKNGAPKEAAYCFKLSEFKGGMEVQKAKVLESIDDPNCKYFYETIQNDFLKIPGIPIAYWISDGLLATFNSRRISDLGNANNGLTTGNNNRFLRLWAEVKFNNISFGMSNFTEAQLSGKRWFPYNKGGEFRKWYGNNDFIINWFNDGADIKKYNHLVPRSMKYQFQKSISWSKISSSTASFKLKEQGTMFDVAGLSLFPYQAKDYNYLLGLCNSRYAQKCFEFLSPTLNYETGHIAVVPVILLENKREIINSIVENNMQMSRDDWDLFETSWNFKKHFLYIKELVNTLIDDMFKKSRNKINRNFQELKANEEELNKIFIDIYGLQSELSPEVEDKDVTVHYIANTKEDAPEGLQKSSYLLTKQDLIKSLISYAVGCIFGRYSLDEEGLIYAGGDWDPSRYQKFPADQDNILPICDEEYFEDDIVGLFIKFIETVYGEETLEENLSFIADALGGKGTPREVIRKYFLNDFFKDHCKTYKKRPIYWLFDSGKKNGFKALVYMHRYQPDTIARMRTDYVHEQQSRYRTAITDLENRLNDTSTSERVRLNKQLVKLKAQSDEIRIYEEKIHHIADQMIAIDLDDGVKHNYALFQDVLAKIK